MQPEHRAAKGYKDRRVLRALLVPKVAQVPQAARAYRGLQDQRVARALQDLRVLPVRRVQRATREYKV